MDQDAALWERLDPMGGGVIPGELRRFLERRGEGVHHVGYCVVDLEASMAAVEGAGIRLLDSRPRHGSLGASIAFLHPGDIGGVLTELVQSAVTSPGA